MRVATTAILDEEKLSHTIHPPRRFDADGMAIDDASVTFELGGGVVLYARPAELRALATQFEEAAGAAEHVVRHVVKQAMERAARS